jgi:hypothetical protein
MHSYSWLKCLNIHGYASVVPDSPLSWKNQRRGTNREADVPLIMLHRKIGPNRRICMQIGHELMIHTGHRAGGLC